MYTPDSVSHASLSCNSCTKIQGWNMQPLVPLVFHNLPSLYPPSFRRNDFYTSYFSLAFEWYWFRTQKQTGADKNVLSSTVPMSRKRRSLYGLPRPNGTTSPYATPQGDSTYVYLKDCRCFGCLSLLVVRAETDKLTGSCAGVNYASKMNVE